MSSVQLSDRAPAESLALAESMSSIRSAEQLPSAILTELAEWSKGSRPRKVELPFSVRLARTEDKLLKAVKIRAAAYGRHVPTLAETLVEPEHVDRQRGTVVFIAESKDDGTALGTLRIQNNHALPLKVEQSFALPIVLSDRSLVEVTRLAVVAGSRGALVRLALCKALHRYCFATQIDWIVITARTPLDRMYEKLLFTDLLPGGGFIPMKHIGDIPHRVMALDVVTAERRYAEYSHPHYDFMFRQLHSDIEVFSSVSGSWERPRQRSAPLVAPQTQIVDAPLV